MGRQLVLTQLTLMYAVDSTGQEKMGTFVYWRACKLQKAFKFNFYECTIVADTPPRQILCSEIQGK